MSDHLWAGQDPRDGRRWLAIRRRFRHTAFGYEDATMLDMVSEAERLLLVEDDDPPPLDQDYLVQAIDRIRSRRWEPSPPCARDAARIPFRSPAS